MKVGSYKIKTKKIITIGIVLSIGFILYSVVRTGLRDRYSQDIDAFREQKNEHFKKAESSPIEDQVGFKGLRYFEPDKKYRVVASLKRIQDSSYVFILNNDGEKNKYWKYAWIYFKVNAVEDSLILYRKAGLDKDNKNYFLPFFDETNGDETYEGGRYIDIDLKTGDSFVLDFNLAYNPYCVYNYRYSCPIPPKENSVDTKIMAGERMFLK